LETLTMSWWTPEAHADRKPFLEARGRVRRAVRGWFETRGFTEVECGALQASPGNEAHLHAFATERLTESGARETLYLHTSPEFASKKLLAAGETRIFDLARVYRNREAGPLHAPEFTMLEWYRAGASWNQVMEDTVDICLEAMLAAGQPVMAWRGGWCKPDTEAERLTVTEAFERYAGIDLLSVLGDRDALAEAARGIGMRVGEGDNWSDIFSRVLVQKVEEQLGYRRLTLLCEYPASEAALARPCAHDPRFAERFELYACGVELANGFGELTDADEQRRRFISEMDEKQRIYGERYPVDEDFLEALKIMPQASGVAMGFDRLVMLVSGARHIRDVLWTPMA
jgi:lysyl-tRNA synthetase class 2